jgi:hypothetical protein
MLQQESKVLILLPDVATGTPQDQLKVLSTLLKAHWMPSKGTTFQSKTLNNEGRCKSHCLINQFAIGPNFQEWLKKRFKSGEHRCGRIERSMGPCFLVQRG